MKILNNLELVSPKIDFINGGSVTLPMPGVGDNFDIVDKFSEITNVLDRHIITPADGSAPEILADTISATEFLTYYDIKFDNSGSVVQFALSSDPVDVFLPNGKTSTMPALTISHITPVLGNSPKYAFLLCNGDPVRYNVIVDAGMLQSELSCIKDYIQSNITNALDNVITTCGGSVSGPLKMYNDFYIYNCAGDGGDIIMCGNTGITFNGQDIIRLTPGSVTNAISITGDKITGTHNIFGGTITASEFIISNINNMTDGVNVSVKDYILDYYWYKIAAGATRISIGFGSADCVKTDNTTSKTTYAFSLDCVELIETGGCQNGVFDISRGVPEVSITMPKSNVFGENMNTVVHADVSFATEIELPSGDTLSGVFVTVDNSVDVSNATIHVSGIQYCSGG